DLDPLRIAETWHFARIMWPAEKAADLCPRHPLVQPHEVVAGRARLDPHLRGKERSSQHRGPGQDRQGESDASRHGGSLLARRLPRRTGRCNEATVAGLREECSGRPLHTQTALAVHVRAVAALAAW